MIGIRRPVAEPPRGMNRLATVPLSRLARDELLRAIREGTFSDGRLPPEDELAQLLGVSRTTLRAALQSLAADGIISRRRRHGTVINTHLLRSSMRLNRLIAFTALIEESGHEASVDPHGLEVAPAPAEAAKALALNRGAECLLVERLLRASGEPVIVVLDVVPLDRLAVAPEDCVEADSTFAFLAANAVAPAEYSTADIVPRVATAGRPRGLDIAAGSAYIELLETSFARDHTPIAFSRVSVDDAVVRLSLLRQDG